MQTKQFATFFLIVFLVLPLTFFRVTAADTPSRLIVALDKDYYYIQGEPITIHAYSNMTVNVNLCVYWNWRDLTDNVLIYNNSRLANATWILPTSSQDPGYYKFEFKSNGETVTTWTTLIHATDWTIESLPYSSMWKGVNYTLEGRTLTAETGDDLITLTYPKIPFEYNTVFLRNNMTFLIRLSGSTWAVDVCYMALYCGLKWVINGSLDNPGTFEFQCQTNPLKKWKYYLDSFKNENLLTFDWSDLRKAAHAFEWDSVTSTLSVSIPSSFSIDPYIFEDGFDDGTLDAWTGTDTDTGCTVDVVDDPVYSGDYSMESYCDADAEGWAEAYVNFASTAICYVRAYYYFDDLPTTNSYFQFQSLRASLGGWAEQAVCLLKNDAGNYYWGVNCREVKTYKGTSDAVNPDTWYCIELMRDVTNSKCSLWIDGVAKITDQASAFVGNSASLLEGIDTFDASGPNTFYVDAAIINSAYIGPVEEPSGQWVNFTCTQAINIWDSGTQSRALAFSSYGTIMLYSSGTMNKAVGFYLDATINVYASTTMTRAFIFMCTETIIFYASGTASVELAIVVAEFITSGLVKPSASVDMGRELQFSIYEALISNWLDVFGAVTVSSLIGFVGLAFIIALAALALPLLLVRRRSE